MSPQYRTYVPSRRDWLKVSQDVGPGFAGLGERLRVPRTASWVIFSRPLRQAPTTRRGRQGRLYRDWFVLAKLGWGSRAVECRTYGAPGHPPFIPQPFRAGLTSGGPALRA
jgi:hypothetical protein